MKTKIIIAIAISLLSAVPFIVNADEVMMQTYHAEAVAMDQANECRRATGTYSKLICMLRTRNVKNGAVK